MVSPDYFNDPTKNFIDYYLIEKSINKKEIKNNLSYLLNKHKFDDFLKTALIQSYLKDRNKCYIINSPVIFKGVWNFIKIFIHKDTKKKIHFIKIK